MGSAPRLCRLGRHSSQGRRCRRLLRQAFYTVTAEIALARAPAAASRRSNIGGRRGHGKNQHDPVASTSERARRGQVAFLADSFSRPMAEEGFGPRRWIQSRKPRSWGGKAQPPRGPTTTPNTPQLGPHTPAGERGLLLAACTKGSIKPAHALFISRRDCTTTARDPATGSDMASISPVMRTLRKRRRPRWRVEKGRWSERVFLAQSPSARVASGRVRPII